MREVRAKVRLISDTRQGRHRLRVPARTTNKRQTTSRRSQAGPPSSRNTAIKTAETVVRTLEISEIKKLSRVATKTQLLRASLERHQTQHRKKSLKLKIKRFTPAVAAIIILTASSYVIIEAWLVNSEARRQMSTDQVAVAIANNTDATPEERQAAEGKDESDRSAALDNYQVEASLPRAIFIDKLNVKARVLPMSVNPDGSMQAPINIFDAGWYTGSVRPGQLGASVIVGHASGPTREGLFAYLDTLSPGDTIIIERGNGTKLNYRVTEKKNVPLDQVNMNEMLSTRGTEEGLNIMTCGGKWLPDKKTFGERVMLFTKRIS